MYAQPDMPRNRVSPLHYRNGATGGRVPGLLRTHFVTASVAWQSRRRSNVVRRLVFNLKSKHRNGATGGRVPGLLRTHFVTASVAWQSRRRSNVVRRLVFNLIEIAASLDELGMSGRSSQ